MEPKKNPSRCVPKDCPTLSNAASTTTYTPVTRVSALLSQYTKFYSDGNVTDSSQNGLNFIPSTLVDIVTSSDTKSTKNYVVSKLSGSTDRENAASITITTYLTGIIVQEIKDTNDTITTILSMITNN